LGGVRAVEQADAGAEQHGRERNPELVDQAAVQGTPGSSRQHRRGAQQRSAASRRTWPL
jgi:hypothetical protein